MSYGYREFDDFASTSPNSNTSNPQLVRHLEDVRENVQHFCNNVNTIERKIDELNNNDTPAAREEIVQLVADTAQLAKITNIPIQKLRLQNRQLSNADRNQFERIMTNFNSAGIKYRQLQKNAQDLEKEMIDRSRQARQRSSSSYSDTDVSSSNPFPDEKEELQHNDDHARSHDQFVLQQELETDASLLEEREQQMRQLEGDIIDINDIFRDLGTMVHDQGDVIDNIEAHVEIAAIGVEKGNKQLRKAVQHKKVSRKLTLAILCVVLVIVIAIIIGILAVLGFLGVFKK